MLNQTNQFPGQRSNEEIVTILKKHWLLISSFIIRGIACLVLGLLLLSVPNVASYLAHSTVLALIYTLWMIFWSSYIIYYVMNWQNDRFIVTNQRIVEIDQQGAFSRKIVEIELSRIQDIHHEINGFWASISNIGNLHISSGGQKDMVMEGMARPAEIQEMLTQLISELIEDKPMTAEELVQRLKASR